MIGSIQEETHRSAITYQRKLRGEDMASQLDAIEGIGPKRRNALLKHFRSLKAISTADEDALRAVLPAPAAKAVHSYFHGEEEQPCASSPVLPGAES